MMSTLNFNEFTRKLYIARPQEDILPLWTTSAGICSWFLEVCTYTDPDGNTRAPEESCMAGDRYQWKWHNWDAIESGLILETGTNSFAFEFAQAKVRVNLEQHKGKSLLILRQTDIPTDEESKLKVYTGCSNGWTFWLTNLKAFIEHGILLNERDPIENKDPLLPYQFVNI